MTEEEETVAGERSKFFEQEMAERAKFHEQAVRFSEAFIFGNDLTPRERSVARLLMAGYSTHTMAHILMLSEKTLKHHISSIFHKAEVGSRSEFCSKAFGYDDVTAKRLNAADPVDAETLREHKRERLSRLRSNRCANIVERITKS